MSLPGFLGKETNNDFQLWHNKTITDGYLIGLDVLFNGEETNCIKEPFVEINNKYFCVPFPCKVLCKRNIIVLPHPESPIEAIPCVWDGWWDKKFIYFKMKAFEIKRKTPIAKIIPQMNWKMESINSYDKLTLENIETMKATRKWKTSSGFIQDNSYEVTSKKQPFRKKFKVFNVVGKDKKDI